MPVDCHLVSAAAAGLNTLAKALERSGETEKADALSRQAAELELGSPDLQNCWDGPLNDQVGRQATLVDVLDRVAPVAVIETGTFRGITTAWFARNFSGAIRTCGPGRSLDIDYVKTVVPHGSRLFFPRLRSAEETGAVRGCCIIAANSAQRLDACPLLRGQDLE